VCHITLLGRFADEAWPRGSADAGEGRQRLRQAQQERCGRRRGNRSALLFTWRSCQQTGHANRLDVATGRNRKRGRLNMPNSGDLAQNTAENTSKAYLRSLCSGQRSGSFAHDLSQEIWSRTSVDRFVTRPRLLRPAKRPSVRRASRRPRGPRQRRSVSSFGKAVNLVLRKWQRGKSA
jgi:hypothetical protein